MGLSESELLAICQWAFLTPSVREVWLFGSRAKSSHRPDSDIDLAIVLMPPTEGTDWARWNYERFGDGWQRQLGAIIGRRVSLTEKADETEPSIRLWARADLSEG
jgi:predicted nucleotidyltransferase